MQNKSKITSVVSNDMPGYRKIIKFYYENDTPAINPPWGHEMRETLPDSNGIVTIILYGIDGELQHPDGHSGFCFPFTCKGHFDHRKGMKIRLTAAPLIIPVGGIAKMGLYGELQRVYDSNGNELVLNQDKNNGYKLFLVSPQKRVMAKYFLRDGHNLRLGDEGYAYVLYQYDSQGNRIGESKYGLNGEEL